MGAFLHPKIKKDQQIRNEDIMIKGISKYEQFKVVRTLFGEHKTDMFEMPVIKAVHESEITIDKIEPLNFKNLSKKHNNQNKLMLGFNYDSELLRLWNEPLKYVGLLQSCGALCTPDYSVYASMNKNDIQHNIYQNRWLGCLWQDYGCTVIPTISWATEETYDICFSGAEQGGIVIISTLGCTDNTDIFMAGFDEMKKRLKPSLIIVYGKWLDGMSGRFIHYDYKDAFNKATDCYEQLELFAKSSIFEVKRGA